MRDTKKRATDSLSPARSTQDESVQNQPPSHLIGVTPGGPLFAPAVGFAGALAVVGFAATVTSPFGWRTSCTPAPACTDVAPDRFSDPPASVTLLLPLDTVIVPGELEVTDKPLPLNIADVVTPFDSFTVVNSGDGPLGTGFPPEACGGRVGRVLPTGFLGLLPHSAVGTMMFPQPFFFCVISFFLVVRVTLFTLAG